MRLSSVSGAPAPVVVLFLLLLLMVVVLGLAFVRDRFLVNKGGGLMIISWLLADTSKTIAHSGLLCAIHTRFYSKSATHSSPQDLHQLGHFLLARRAQRIFTRLFSINTTALYTGKAGTYLVNTVLQNV